MIYFTIPQYALGGGQPASDTDIYLDNSVQIPNRPSLRKQRFGDGYSISVPVGPRKRNFSGSFTFREISVIDMIDQYFELLEGEPINGFYILGTATTIICKSWIVTDRSDDIASLTGQFEEQFT